jgi:hypothetical protein
MDDSLAAREPAFRAAGVHEQRSSTSCTRGSASREDPSADACGVVGAPPSDSARAEGRDQPDDHARTRPHIHGEKHACESDANKEAAIRAKRATFTGRGRTAERPPPRPSEEAAPSLGSETEGGIPSLKRGKRAFLLGPRTARSPRRRRPGEGLWVPGVPGSDGRGGDCAATPYRFEG